RNAVVLRFFQNKTAAEVAVALNTTEAAAHKRVSRALEKLRGIFAKRGLKLSAALVAGAVSANSVHAAPIGLGQSIPALAIGKGAAAISTLTLAKGTIKIMTWTKVKITAAAGIALLMIGGAATFVSQSSTMQGPPALEIAKQALSTYAALQSYS